MWPSAFAIVAAALVSFAGSTADRKEAANGETDYVRVQMQGKLEVVKVDLLKDPSPYLIVCFHPVRATITAGSISWDLALGSSLSPDRELVASAEKLRGKVVVVEGAVVLCPACGLDGARFPPRIFVRVSNLKEAPVASDRKDKKK